MTLIGEKLTSYAAFHKVLSVCSGHWPEEASPESLAYEGAGCGVMAAQTSVYSSQEFPPLLLGDTSLEDSSSALFLQFTFMNFIGFRASNYATGLILIIGKLLSVKVGQERFGLGSNNNHYFMDTGCYFCIRTPDDSCGLFGCWGCY